MRRLITVLLLSYFMVFSIVPFASADEKRPVTPYGDFCPNCSRYGFCKFNLSIEEARKALEDYYKKQGLSVRIEKSMGRFIRATVFREDKAVDRIILDRRTGRIRSIY